VSPVTVDDSQDSDAGLTFSSYSCPALDMKAVSGKELLLKATFLAQHGLLPCDPHLRQSKL